MLLHQNILTFFSTPDLTHTDVTDLQEIRDYQIGDAKRDINRKKTAQSDKLMTNVFEQDKNIHGKIVRVVSQNRKKGNQTDANKELDSLMAQLESGITGNPWNIITQSTITQIPSFIGFFEQKTIIVSDFFRPSKDLSIFLQACNQGKARGLVIPMYTPTGKYSHPLVEKYPHLIWQM